jgi:hypothetical protein
MSRITIIIEDGFVRQDSVQCEGVDVSSAPVGLHAFQWYGTKGELEFSNLVDGTKPQNEFVTELPAWASTCVANIPARQAQIEAEILQRTQNP